MGKELETNIAIGGQLDPSLNKVIGAVNRNLDVLTKQAALANKTMGKSGTTMSSVMGKIGTGAKKMGELGKAGFHAIEKGAKAAVAGVAIVATVAASATAGAYKLADGASNLGESANVVQQTFKGSSDSILKWTDTVAGVAGISQANATAFVGSMGAMLKSSGIAESSAGLMSKSLVQLTGDLSSFYNLSNDDAWEKIRAGIAGETEPLRQIGINMSTANMQAYALANGIKQPWAKMSQAQQTMLRYNYLMSVTKDAQGDFGRTLETSFANQVRVAKLNFETLGNTVGKKFLPDFMVMVKAVNEGFKTGDWSKASQTVGKGLTGVLNTVTSMAPQVINIAAEIMPALATGVATSMPSFTLALVSGVLKAVGLLTQQAPTLVPALLNTVQFLLEGLTAGIIQYAPALTTAAIQLLVGFVGMLATAAPTVLPVLVNSISQLIGAAVGLLPTVLPVLVNGFLYLLNAAIAVLSTNGTAFLTAALNAVMQLALGLFQAAPKLIPVVLVLLKSLVNWLGANLQMIVSAGIDLVLQLALGIVQAIPELIPMIPQIIMTIVNTLTTCLPQLTVAALQIIIALAGSLVSNLPQIITAAIQIITSLVNGLLVEMPKQANTLAPQLLDALKTAFGGVDWGQLGVGMLVAIVNGLSSMGNMLVGAVNAIFVDPINKALAQLHIPFQLPHIPNIPTVQVPAYASGVVNAPGGVSLVGERGPELINLPRGSTVYNNNQTRQMLSGGNPVFQFFIQITGGTGTEREDVRRGMMEALPAFEDAMEAWGVQQRRVSFGY